MSKGGQTRQRIVAKAATLFNQRGFDGSSMADLMEATGLEKGGIYRHFSTKEELAAEAFDYAWQAATEVGMRDLDSVPNSVNKLKRFISNFIDQRPPVPGGCPLLNTAIACDSGNPILRERARKALHQWQDLLSGIVRTGVQRKEIRNGVDPKKLVTLILGSLEGALMICRLDRNREALVEIQSHLERYLDSAIRLRQK